MPLIKQSAGLPLCWNFVFGRPTPKRTHALGSAEGGAGDQEQACSDDDKSDGSSDVLTGWGKAFYGDGRCYESHRAQVHDTENQEDRCQASTTVAAVEAETQAVSPGCAGIRW